MIKKIICIIFFALSVSCGFSQNSNNGWNIYTSFRDVRGITDGNNLVWGATSGGLFSFNPNNLSVASKYTSLDGLLSNELTAITFSTDGNVWVGAFDGSISVLNTADNTWRQITDIRSSTETAKRINTFYQYNNYMFFGTEFCIVKFSIPQFQFVDQPYRTLGNLDVPAAVNQVMVINDTIWAATSNGIAYANINYSLPIASTWRTFKETNSVLIKNLSNCVSYFGARVIIGSDSGLVSYQNGSLTTYAPLYNGVPIEDPVYRLGSENGVLYFSTYTNYDNHAYKGNFKVYKVNQNNINNAQLVLSGIEVNALKVNNSDLLLGSVNKGVDVFRNNSNNYVYPNGPGSNVFQDLATDITGNIWSVSGGLNAGVYKFNLSSWKNYTTDEYPWMIGNDFRHIYASKYSSNVWAGGYGSGLLNILGDSLTLYNNQNSCLQSLSGNFTLAEGIGEDNGGNLWVINRASTVPIVRFIPQPCLAYPVPSNQSATTMIYMAIDNYNTKWMSFPSDLSGQERGVVYFNENTSPSGLIIAAALLGADIHTVYHVVVDKNGEVWIGTDNGIAIIRDPSQVINNPGTVPF